MFGAHLKDEYEGGGEGEGGGGGGGEEGGEGGAHLEGELV